MNGLIYLSKGNGREGYTYPLRPQENFATVVLVVPAGWWPLTG
jgi:hypothetical protein